MVATIMMTAWITLTGTMDLVVKIVKTTMKSTVMKVGMTKMMTMRTLAIRITEITTGMRSSCSSDEKKQTDM